MKPWRLDMAALSIIVVIVLAALAAVYACVSRLGT